MGSQAHLERERERGTGDPNVKKDQESRTTGNISRD